MKRWNLPALSRTQTRSRPRSEMYMSPLLPSTAMSIGMMSPLTGWSAGISSGNALAKLPFLKVWMFLLTRSTT